MRERQELEPRGHDCTGLVPLPPRRRRARFFGLRELLLAGAALGMMVGVTWVDERYACAHIEEHPGDLVERDEALESYLEARCELIDCDQAELVSTRGCLAKIRVQAPRVDEYGDELGTFVSVEGLRYSPVFGRWWVRETLEDKQLLGLPVP
jgi:hypothetical protein